MKQNRVNAFKRTLRDYDRYIVDRLSGEKREDWFKAANKFPTGPFEDYRKALDNYVDELGEVFDRHWQRRIKVLVRRQMRESSRLDDVQDQLNKAFNNLERDLSGVREDLDMTTKARQLARQTKRKAVNNFQQEVQRILGDDFRPFIRNETLDRYVSQSVDSNVRLIKSISSDYHDNLSREIYNGIQQGTPIEDLAETVGKEFNVAKGRVKTIAMDQTNSLHSAINRAQQKDMGLDRYRWWTVMDGNQRPSHGANHREIFKWDNSPLTGHPGDDINCRCYAQPLESELREYAETDTGQAMAV